MPPILTALIYLLIILLVLWTVYWGLCKIATAVGAPPPVMVVIQVIFVILLVIAVVGFLLQLIGAGSWYPIPLRR